MDTWRIISGIGAGIIAIFLIIKGIMDLRDGTEKLLESGKNAFQRFLFIIIGFPLLVLALILGFVHDATPLVPLIAPTPTFSFPLFSTPTP